LHSPSALPTDSDIDGIMGRRTREKKSSRQRSRDIAQTIDVGDEQPNTRKKSQNGARSSNNNKTKTRHKHHHKERDEDNHLTNRLAEHGLEVLEMSPDGNCLFRALSDQLHGDYGSDHANIRSEICDFMEQNKQDFKDFLVIDADNDEQEEDARDIEHYVEQMREDGHWGADIEIVAATRLYKRNIRVYSATLNGYTFNHGGPKSAGPDLVVSFHGHDNHYNSIRNKRFPPKKFDVNVNRDINDKERNGAAEKTNKLSSHERTCIDPPGMPAERGRSREKGDVLEESMQKLSLAKRSTRRNDPCYCGSGLRYKKCCSSKQKHAARVESMKSRIEDHDDEDTSGSAEEEDTMPFQTVKI
jgi:OTU domain-containing protein 3